MSCPRVLYDTVILSGVARRDLSPVEEMLAVDIIERWDAEGRIDRVKAKISTIEQARTTDPVVRATLAASAAAVPQVTKDHRLLDFNIYVDQYTCIAYPRMSDIVDEALYTSLTAIGVKHNDAMLIMYAQHNDCEYFITLDTKDILPHREAIEAVCGGLRIVKPSELVAILSTVIPTRATTSDRDL